MTSEIFTWIYHWNTAFPSLVWVRDDKPSEKLVQWKDCLLLWNMTEVWVYERSVTNAFHVCMRAYQKVSSSLLALSRFPVSELTCVQFIAQPQSPIQPVLMLFYARFSPRHDSSKITRKTIKSARNKWTNSESTRQRFHCGQNLLRNQHKYKLVMLWSPLQTHLKKCLILFLTWLHSPSLYLDCPF